MSNKEIEISEEFKSWLHKNHVEGKRWREGAEATYRHLFPSSKATFILAEMDQDFDLFPLPTCMEPREELKQLNLRRMRIEKIVNKIISLATPTAAPSSESIPSSELATHPQWVDAEDELPPFDADKEYNLRYRDQGGWEPVTGFFDADAKQFYAVDHGSNFTYFSLREYPGLQWLKENVSAEPAKESQPDEIKYTRSELFEICGGWSEHIMAITGARVSVLDLSDTFNDWFDKNHPSVSAPHPEPSEQSQPKEELVKFLDWWLLNYMNSKGVTPNSTAIVVERYLSESK